jgi:hypothetical protein
MVSVQKISILVCSVAALSGMESRYDATDESAPHIFIWNERKTTAHIVTAEPEELKKALFHQAYASFLLAQRIDFRYDADESHVVLDNGLTFSDRRVSWVFEGERVLFYDPVQVTWLYSLSTTLTGLATQNRVSAESLCTYAWVIRLFLDECTSTITRSSFERGTQKDTHSFIKACTLAVYNTKILDSLIKLGIFTNSPGGIRNRYITRMIELFPQRSACFIPPLNNRIVCNTINTDQGKQYPENGTSSTRNIPLH